MWHGQKVRKSSTKGCYGSEPLHDNCVICLNISKKLCLWESVNSCKFLYNGDFSGFPQTGRDRHVITSGEHEKEITEEKLTNKVITVFSPIFHYITIKYTYVINIVMTTKYLYCFILHDIVALCFHCMSLLSKIELHELWLGIKLNIPRIKAIPDLCNLENWENRSFKKQFF